MPSQSSAAERKWPGRGRSWGLVVALVVVVAFGPLAASEFVGWDDPLNLYENPRLNPPTWSGVGYYWTHAAHGLYIPLTYSVWGALAALSNLEPDAQGVAMNPWVFHGFNVLLHALAALASFALLTRFFAVAPAAFGALVFALHPVQVESVGWAAGTKDVLCGLLGIVALWQYVEAVRAWKHGADPEAAASDRGAPNPDQPRLPARAHYTLALLAFVLAMLAKPSAVVVPALALVIDIWLLRRRPAASLMALTPWFALSLACAAVARIVQDASLVQPPPLWGRPLIAGDALAFYLFKLVWPLRLGIDYGRSPEYVLSQGWIYLAWLTPAAIVLMLWINRRRRPELFVAGAVFVLALAPVLGLLTFQFQYVSTVADHYLYLAMLGPGMASAWLAGRAAHRWGRAPIIALCSALLLSLGARSALQTRVWRNNQTLFANALRVNERSFVARGGLGMVALHEGNPTKAEDLFRDALRVDPDYQPALANLGWALELQKRYHEAAEAQAAALESMLRHQGVAEERTISRMAGALAFNLARLHRYEEAILKLRLALEHSPNDPELLHWLEEIEQRAARAASSQPAQ